METNERQLLIRDLCSRLPYMVKVHIINKNNGNETDDVLTPSTINHLQDWVVKPYLRPMSSMTEFEKQSLFNAFNNKYAIIGEYCIDCNNHWSVKPRTEPLGFQSVTYESMQGVIDWFNKNHFDYRGLIPMGSALEAPEGMYN